MVHWSSLNNHNVTLPEHGTLDLRRMWSCHDLFGSDICAFQNTAFIEDCFCSPWMWGLQLQKAPGPQTSFLVSTACFTGPDALFRHKFHVQILFKGLRLTLQFIKRIYQFLHRPPKQVTQVLLLRLLPRLISFQRQAPSTATASPRHPALATPRKSRNMGNFEKKTQRLKRWNYVEFHAMSNFCVMTRTRAGELSTGSARPTRLT